MKNEKAKLKLQKIQRTLKIQTKNLLNMNIVVIYSNFTFRIEVKTKSKYIILDFVFRFIKNMKWHFGYTDYNMRQFSFCLTLCLI